MQLLKTSQMEIKKSKFYGYAYRIDSEKDIKEILNKLKTEHKKARHIVYAYKFASKAGKSDDKEPSGTAGSQIYNLIEIKHLDNILIVVVRYFGGIKLGAGLLSRTYKNAALATLQD